MLRRAAIALLLRMTPRRWRDSIAGDFDEARDGAIATVIHGARVVARLWVEELSIGRVRRPRRSVMSTFSFQLRQAVRSLLKRPAYSLIVIATLAIGIGANAAVFGLANWLMFRPVPAVHEPDRLVTIRLTTPDGGTYTMSHPEMLTLQQLTPAIGAIAGSMEGAFDLAGGTAPPERVDGGIVSANYFEVLGVRPVLGRAFSSGEPGVVVSYSYWQTRLGGDPAAVGATLLINGQPQPLIGVAPPGFTGLTRSSSIDAWAPTTLGAALFSRYSSGPLTSMRSSLYFSLVARLADTATLAGARAGLERAPATLAKVHPRPQRYTRARFVADAGLTGPEYERTRLRRTFALLMAMVGLLLVLTCANVGNVMLASGSARRAEIATRQALGASRRQIVASVLLESVLLSLAGGAVAVALAAAVSASMRGTIVLPYLPALGAITLDARVFAFALGISTASSMAAGLLPALAATRFDLISTLKGAGRSVTSASLRLRRALMVAQVALSLTLLVGGFLLARSVHQRRSIDLGFDPSRLSTFSVEPGVHYSDPARLRSFYATLLAQVQAVPGVKSAALGWSAPFVLLMSEGEARAIDGRSSDAVAYDRFRVSPRFFETMGIRIVAGREFTGRDAPLRGKAATGRVIVSASLATRLFGSPVLALGRTIELDFPEGARAQIIGVSVDARQRRAFEPPPPALYLPIGDDSSWTTVHIRSSVPLPALATALREAVRRADPALPPYDMMTVRDRLDRQMSEDVLVGRLAMTFACLATLLAAVGLYGVLAQAVSERRMELGIRAALGAAPARVLRMVTGDALRMALTGTAAGVGLSLWLSQYLESRLFGVERFDAVTFAAACVVVTVTSLAAAAIPALRASRVDPVVALRQ